jgi:superfamily II DNA/RNA helicase
LVATNAASRSVEIPVVDCVINLNVPASSFDYVQRISRTISADQKGVAVTLLTQFDILRLRNIEKYIGKYLGD